MKDKMCGRCRAPLPLSAFYKDKRTPDGVGSWCKLCLREYRTWWRENTEAGKAWYARTKEKTAAAVKRWRERQKQLKLNQGIFYGRKAKG